MHPPTYAPPHASAAIAVTGLTKRYGDRLAVDDLDLALERGTVTGFVGPNGAGKTTTIRMLLGLIEPTAGAGSVLGEPLSAPPRFLSRVGALIEGPAFYPGLSGRENLQVLARLSGLPDARCDEVLATVGLGDRGGDRAGAYSLGMRQRLGIAAALLGRPELLLLDEPTNGLDPAGIREVRALLRGLADEGMTVLVSSHLLSEIEAICDRLVLIQSGRLRFAGTVEALTADRRPQLVAVPEDPRDLDALAEIGERFGLDAATAGGALRAEGDRHAAARLNRAAAERGITLIELRTERPSLEEAFFALTEEQEEAAA